MFPSTLLSDLKGLSSFSPEAANKVTDFNERNKDHFEVPASTYRENYELMDLLFRILQENSKIQADISKDLLAAVAIKEVLTCLKILSRSKEFVSVIAGDMRYFNELTSIARVRDGPGLRNPDHSEEMDKSQLSALKKYAELEALKTICNCIFHSQEFRDDCNKNRCTKFITDMLAEQLPALNSSDEYLSMQVKVLFLMSALDIKEREKMRCEYKANVILVKMLDELLKSVCSQESKKDGCKASEAQFDDDVRLIIEILKALFNITVNVADSVMLEVSECQNYCSLSNILQQLLKKSDRVLPNAVVVHIANMLINIPKGCLHGMIPSVRRRPWQEQVPRKRGYPTEYELKDMSAIITLISCLDDELKKKIAGRLETSHVFSILSSMCHLCRSLRLARKYLRYQILPPLRDVNVRPEKAETLKGRLIKMMTDPDTSLKKMAADFLFVLCKEDPDRLVKHTGYGNAAGLLAMRGLIGKKNAGCTGEYSSDDDDSETEEFSAIADSIDPITGAVSSKSQNPDLFQNMTEEEKEASATELIGLLGKMSSLDIIKPMRIGGDGRPEVLNVEDAKKLVREKLQKDD